ncbi:MAG: hypothetical protein ABIW85_02215 [Variovorax sp.]
MMGRTALRSLRAAPATAKKPPPTPAWLLAMLVLGLPALPLAAWAQSSSSDASPGGRAPPSAPRPTPAQPASAGSPSGTSATAPPHAADASPASPGNRERSKASAPALPPATSNSVAAPGAAAVPAAAATAAAPAISAAETPEASTPPSPANPLQAISTMLSYIDQVRASSQPEAAAEVARLGDPTQPEVQMRLAVALSSSRVPADLARALGLLQRVIASPSAEAEGLRPLARALATRYMEQRRVEEDRDRQAAQLRDVQRKNETLNARIEVLNERIEALNERLDALRAIERSVGRPPVAVLPIPLAPPAAPTAASGSGGNAGTAAASAATGPVPAASPPSASGSPTQPPPPPATAPAPANAGAAPAAGPARATASPSAAAAPSPTPQPPGGSADKAASTRSAP